MSASFLARTEHVMTALPIADNPFLQWILTGGVMDPNRGQPYFSEEGHQRLQDAADRIRFVHADLLAHFEQSPAGTYSAFNLSDVPEYLSERETEALLRAVAGCARPGARVAYWNLLVPRWRPESMADVLDRDTVLGAKLIRQDPPLSTAHSRWRPFDDAADRIVASIVRRRTQLLLLVMVATGLAMLGLTRVGVDNAVEVWFPSDDPALLDYHDFLGTFGNDEVVVIGVYSADGIVSEDGLAKVKAVGEAAERVQGIARVRSIVTEPLVRGDLGSLEVAPISDPEDAARVLERDPLVSAMVADDQRTALVLAEMEAKGGYRCAA